MLVTYVRPLPKGRREGLFAAQIISGITQEGADCRMNVKVAAPAFQIIHYTVDLDEASCGVALLCEDMLFCSSMLLNMPAPGPILAGYTAYSKKRCPKVALLAVKTTGFAPVGTKEMRHSNCHYSRSSRAKSRTEATVKRGIT